MYLLEIAIWIGALLKAAYPWLVVVAIQLVASGLSGKRLIGLLSSGVFSLMVLLYLILHGSWVGPLIWAIVSPAIGYGLSGPFEGRPLEPMWKEYRPRLIRRGIVTLGLSILIGVVVYPW